MSDLSVSTLALLERYDRPGPRYTSYPTAIEFHAGVTSDIYVERLARLNRAGDQPLSAYVHLPFCQERCAFCGCNVVITPHREVASRYLEAVAQEIDLLASHLPERRTISQMHWGGGTPTYYSPDQARRAVRPHRETLYLHPRRRARRGNRSARDHVRASRLLLRSLGFNRLSMGIRTSRRCGGRQPHQSYELTRDLIARPPAGLRSISVDLIYGLPHQTPETFPRRSTRCDAAPGSRAPRIRSRSCRG